MMSKLIRVFSFITYFAVAAFSTNASAALVIDFGTGLLGGGGTISFDGTNAAGTDISIGALSVQGSGATDGVYVTDALLNFDTAADTITVDGTVAGLGINTQVNLLSGSFTDWSFTNIAGVDVFTGTGPDVKSCFLLCALGVDPFTQFEFFGFSLQSLNGNVISTDIVNTAVPVPAAVWLFGSGLLGLVGVARRKALVAQYTGHIVLTQAFLDQTNTASTAIVLYNNCTRFFCTRISLNKEQLFHIRQEWHLT